MSFYAAYYSYSNDLMGKRQKRRRSYSIKVTPLDLCRPDVYMIFNVESMILIWMWLKNEIKRTTSYSGSCDHIYHHCRETSLEGSRSDYIQDVRKNMTRIWLGFASEQGRSNFDKEFPFNKEITIPIRYYKSHTPLRWGESQLDLLEEIIHLKKPIRLGWSPNPCHKKAKYTYIYKLCFNHERFYWRAHYDYLKDLNSSWCIRIEPKPKQMLLDFMLDVRQWIRGGMKRCDLKRIGTEYSDTYEVIAENSPKELQRREL